MTAYRRFKTILTTDPCWYEIPDEARRVILEMDPECFTDEREISAFLKTFADEIAMDGVDPYL